MPITQKRIFEVTIPTPLQRALGQDNYTVTGLKELQQELINFGNEISEVLGSFKPDYTIQKVPSPTGKANYTVSAKGTFEQRNQIFALLKQKSMTSKEIYNTTGFEPQLVFNIMHYLYNTNQVERIQNPDSKSREFRYSLPPSPISVA
jgi:hypothetical protein